MKKVDPISVKLPGLEGEHRYMYTGDLGDGSRPPKKFKYEGDELKMRAFRFLVARENPGNSKPDDLKRIKDLITAFKNEEAKSSTEQHSGHTRLARIYGLDERTEEYYLSEFVPKSDGSEDAAPTLAEYILDKRGGRLSLAEIHGIISQVVSALHWLADKRGHGDVHEGNVLVQQSGRAVLVDFAEARENALLKDLKKLRALLLCLLTGYDSRHATQAENAWKHNNPKTKKEDRLVINEAIGVLASAIAEAEGRGHGVEPTTAAMRSTLESFLDKLVQAPSVTPMPFPASVGFLLAQAILFASIGGFLVFLAVSSFMTPNVPTSAYLTPTAYPLPEPPTPILTLPATAPETVSPASTTTPVPPPTTLPPTSPTPSDTPPTRDTPTPMTDTPVPTATETPSPTPKPVVSQPPIVAKASPSSTPAFPLDKLPYNCAPNEETIAKKSFGFIEPLSHQDFYGGRVRVKVDDSLNYTVRAMTIEQLPVTRNIDDWRALEECVVLSTGGVRCQRDVPSRNEHKERWDPQGNLYVDWRGVDSTRYALILQVEQLEGAENQRTLRQYCAYVYDVTYRSQSPSLEP